MLLVRFTYQRSASGPCSALASAVFISGLLDDGAAYAEGCYEQPGNDEQRADSLVLSATFMAILPTMSARLELAWCQVRFELESWALFPAVPSSMRAPWDETPKAWDESRSEAMHHRYRRRRCVPFRSQDHPWMTRISASISIPNPLLSLLLLTELRWITRTSSQKPTAVLASFASIARNA